VIGVDVGGTFTDVVKIHEGRIFVSKVPTDVASSDRSVLEGAASLDLSDVSVFNLASTAGLNAVITRNTPKVALLATKGHRDVLERGRLGRPWSALTDAGWRREFGDTRRPLVPRYLRRGIVERITTTGEVLIALDVEQARHEIDVLRRCGVEAVAICLLNSYLNPAHEQQLRDIVLEGLGDIACSISSAVSPLAKEYPRAMTTVVDAVMKAKYSDYTDRLSEGLTGLGFDGTFNYSDCAARLLPADYAMERPYRLVVGGPAGGTAASAHFGAQIQDSQLLCADVGGTSCDISLVHHGEPWLNSTFELEHDLHVTALSTDVVTLGAGGGSIVSVSSTGEIRVGPESAGAHPGPACYGSGGEKPTLTDAAVLIGILDPDRFLGGKVPLRPHLAERAFEMLDTTLPLAKRVDYGWRMGVHNVAEGILNICVRHGIDVRDYTLMAFGAAGGMLLPSLLDVLPLRRVVVPPHPGLFSALGLLSTDQVYSDHQTAYTMLTADAAPRLSDLFASMEKGLIERVGDVGDVELRRSFDGRLEGQSSETPFVPVPGGVIDAAVVDKMIADFHDVYERRTGNAFRAIPVQGVTFRVEMYVPTQRVVHATIERTDSPPVPAASTNLRFLGGQEGQAMVYDRESLGAGARINGPAIVREALSTTFVTAGTELEVGDHGELIITNGDRS